MERLSVDIDLDRMNKNHPLDLRVLSLEKNHLSSEQKINTIKEIIEHQNQRIDLLEKELDLLRKSPEKAE